MTPRTRKQTGWIEPGIRRITLPISGETRFRVQLGTRTYRRSHLCKTYHEAQALKEEWTVRGLPPKDAPPIASDDTIVATVDDGFRHRVLALEQQGKDSGVTERIRVFLDAHLTAVKALPLSAVTVETIEQYRDARLRTCKENTVVRELREWRAMVKKARPDGFVLPVAVFPPENMTRVRQLTPDEYATVFPYLAVHYGDVFAELSELALLGVMRQADVRLLQRRHVRLAERLLLLPRSKGGEPRQVRLSDAAITILRRALARQPRHDYVFANPRTGQPYSRVHVSRCWHQAAEAVGLEDFTFHDLRHHGPTVAVNAGANTATLQAMGGWKSAKMVERYAHVLNETVDHYLELIAGQRVNRSLSIARVKRGSVATGARTRTQRSSAS